MRAAYESSAGNAATNCLFAPPGERFAVLAIRGRHVEIQCAQQHSACVPDLVLFAALDEQESARCESAPLARHHRRASSLEHEQPLVGAAVAIARAALGAAGFDHHLRRFGSAISAMDAETLAEGEVLEFHERLRATRMPGTLLARDQVLLWRDTWNG